MAENHEPGITIVHLGVGQGDCTLIIIKDFAVGPGETTGQPATISILIDTGPADVTSVIRRTARFLWRVLVVLCHKVKYYRDIFM